MAPLVGSPVRRSEDLPLLTGSGRFVDDIVLPGMTTMVYVRSQAAHATILAIDTTEARAMPGVLGVWTAADLADLPAIRSVPTMERYPLAKDAVRFVGEPVAVVVATDRARAVDAAEKVQIDYDPLPVLTTIGEAMSSGAAPIVPGQASNVVIEMALTEDDAQAEIDAAPHVSRLHLVNQRVAPVPIEPIGCVADWSARGATLWATVQAPHPIRNELCEMFGLSQQQMRVVAPDVGGAFGSKASFYPEYLLTLELSRRLGRPVKYVETRSENMVAMTHGRAQTHDLCLAYDDEGKILALQVKIIQDCGAWPDVTGSGLPTLTSFMAGGCYKIPKIGASFRSVTTNTTPVAAYRGAGRPEAAYLIERLVDVAAGDLGIDPAEFRRRNLIQPEEMPYPTQFPIVVYDESDYPRLLEMLLEKLDYEGVRREQEVRRQDPEAPLLGVGLSVFVEMAGFGPSAFFEQFGYVGGWESAKVRMNPDGSVLLGVGTSPHGQGHETVFAQIAADELGGLAFDRIVVEHGDTAAIQESIGTMGSRAVPVAGPAVQMASRKLRERLVEVAAHMLEASVDDIELHDGVFAVKGVPGSSVQLGDVAMTAYKPHKLAEGSEVGLEFVSYHEPTNLSYPSGAHGCLVEIDRATGEVSILRYVAVDDCGVVINPLLARGQVHGGVVQGIAQALLEEVTFGEGAQPVTSTLVDYSVPSAADMPDLETFHLEVPTTGNSLGAKGLGEAGATAAPQAVVNAVVDAVSHLGIRTLDMPLTPLKVWRAINPDLQEEA
ncbi:xanthine dehydrogenase family protein molybdopterin-binding subunit [Mumia sp. ZJ1417]|uniref:xanthine dehydrogenase family protein molybdopterin-binding subunit n=1 Tax=unclassified Mumia TaxID=2621872 RepID=UPI001421E370|nr:MULTISPECIES: xanthine dehydrogenase family protein molybdopterin-binding subunit [unclassified Mumia]QMW65821.1 xanthine dehydrogenase family protein molybdopterin-binding subunit [Mumia sp. ZJ1417]